MAIWYADTSAALKLVLEEAESSALAAAIADGRATLIGTRLLETEMRRAAHRSPDLDQAEVTAFLATLDIYSLTDALYRQAGLLPGANLRSLDALHLAAAVALGVDAILTYDLRMAEAAGELGVPVIAPTDGA